MGTGIAAAAHMGVAAVSAPAARGPVEVEAHCLGAARFSVKVSRRTDILSVIGTRASITVGLSEACESHCPQLKVDLIPAQGQVVGRPATELLVVREPNQTLKFSDCSANNLLIFDKFKRPSWVGIHKY